MDYLRFVKSSLFSIISFILLQTGKSDGCTFSPSLMGTWVASDRGSLTLSNTTVLNLNMGSYGNLNFECYDTNGTKYVVRSRNVPVIPPFVSLDLFICFDFEQVTSTLYKYWQASSPNSAINNERALAKGLGENATIGEVCNVPSPYAVGSYSFLLRNGSVATNIITCPADLEHRFNYTVDVGGSNDCSGNSLLDNCADSKTLAANYTYCSTKIFYSAGGDVSCLYSTTSGNLTYLTLHNSDVTVDGSAAFRFSCLVFSTSGYTTYATQHPKDCATGQTDRNVTGAGVKLLLNSQGPCNPTTVANQNITTTQAPPTTSTTTTTSIPTTTASAGSIHACLVAVAVSLFIHHLISGFHCREQ